MTTVHPPFPGQVDALSSAGQGRSVRLSLKRQLGERAGGVDFGTTPGDD